LRVISNFIQLLFNKFGLQTVLGTWIWNRQTNQDFTQGAVCHTNFRRKLS